MKVFGHETQKNIFRLALRLRRIHHATLISGPSHVGKSTLMRCFCQMILCEKPDGKAFVPCGRCLHCSQMEKGIHSDVYFLEKESEKFFIPIERIRQLKETLYQKSFLGSYKIAILKNIEHLSLEAGNALLKLLEEPPPGTIFLMTSSNLSNVLPTMLSRTQKYSVSIASDVEIFDFLKDLSCSDDEAKNIAELTFGKLGCAKRYAENRDDFEHALKLWKLVSDILDRGSMDNEQDIIKHHDISEVMDFVLHRVRKSFLESDQGEDASEKQQRLLSHKMIADWILEWRRKMEKIPLSEPLLLQNLFLQIKKQRV
ncbi:MAG: hypothetical protein HY453_00155 [Parcubacteria group bacterium]|nr:hypothetical protein [Parcubacteria group bacterium]